MATTQGGRRPGRDRHPALHGPKGREPPAHTYGTTAATEASDDAASVKSCTAAAATATANAIRLGRHAQREQGKELDDCNLRSTSHTPEEMQNSALATLSTLMPLSYQAGAMSNAEDFTKQFMDDMFGGGGGGKGPMPQPQKQPVPQPSPMQQPQQPPRPSAMASLGQNQQQPQSILKQSSSMTQQSSSSFSSSSTTSSSFNSAISAQQPSNGISGPAVTAPASGRQRNILYDWEFRPQ